MHIVKTIKRCIEFYIMTDKAAKSGMSTDKIKTLTDAGSQGLQCICKRMKRCSWRKLSLIIILGIKNYEYLIKYCRDRYV